jgi:3-hydroxy-9,10-secoandrosta-1,3,5(10)-triene-9,17-dione monooxygenase reductase component
VTIHSENPFEVPLGQRNPVRRLRGRLAAPVTIVTAQDDRPAGLTVSSLLVVEGEVSRVAALVGAGSDLLPAVETSGAFVAHVLTDQHRSIADVFAGLRPAPGGMFTVVRTEETAWGPHLADVSDWAGCRLEEIRPLGEQFLLVGAIEDLSVSELSSPLIHFRGVYRRLAP